MKVCALAEAHHAVVTPHSCGGPVNLACCLAIDATAPNFLIQELSPVGQAYIDKETREYCRFIIREGYFELSDKPGWGVELVPDIQTAVPASEMPWPM